MSLSYEEALKIVSENNLETLVEEEIERNRPVVISRDDLVEAAGRKRGMSYTTAFNFLIKNKEVTKNEVDDVLNHQINDSRKNNKDVIIDMTNMVKKARRKWINHFSKYNKKAVVFLTGFEELKTRNMVRTDQTGKFIPEKVLIRMCRNFTLPLYSEGLDDISYVWT